MAKKSKKDKKKDKKGKKKYPGLCRPRRGIAPGVASPVPSGTYR